MPVGLKVLGIKKESMKSSSVAFSDLRLKNKMAGKTSIGEDEKIARIRFLSDWGDSLVWGCFHAVPTKSRLGADYNKDVYCLRSANDDTECPWCQNEDKDISWTSMKFFFFVWVYEKYHKVQNAEKTWQKIEYAGEEYYLEPINAVQILRIGPGKDRVYEVRFDSWYKRFKTLTDRDYDWCRNGIQFNDTSYDLVPRDEKTKLTDEQEKIKSCLPDLESIVIRKPAAVKMSDDKQAKDGAVSDSKKESASEVKKTKVKSAEDLFAEDDE